MKLDLSNNRTSVKARVKTVVSLQLFLVLRGNVSFFQCLGKMTLFL